MAQIKKYELKMTVVGDFPVTITLEAENPDEEFVCLQQKAVLEGQLGLINQQLKGEV